MCNANLSRSWRIKLTVITLLTGGINGCAKAGLGRCHSLVVSITILPTSKLLPYSKCLKTMALQQGFRRRRTLRKHRWNRVPERLRVALVTCHELSREYDKPVWKLCNKFNGVLVMLFRQKINLSWHIMVKMTMLNPEIKCCLSLIAF